MSCSMVSPLSRAKMLDWMLSIFGFYGKTCTDYTYFRAVFIFDSMIKMKPYLTNDKIHLLGVVCMFMATKLEDYNFIPMSDFIREVSKNSFSPIQIKDTEEIIMATLDYNIYFPTTLDFLDLVLKLNQMETADEAKILKETCVYILRMTLVDPSFHEEDPVMLGVAVVITSLKFVSFPEIEEMKGNSKKAKHSLRKKEREFAEIVFPSLVFPLYFETVDERRGDCLWLFFQ